VIVPDVNVLLYAYDTNSARHDVARAWWERVLSDTEPVGLPWVTVLGFVRITTHPRVFQSPMTVTEATAHVDEWFEQAVTRSLHPGERHWAILSTLLRESRAAANLTTDAHLAALAIEYGGTVYSSDADFRRFRGLKLENPLG